MIEPAHNGDCHLDKELFSSLQHILAIPHRSPQDAAQDIIAAIIAGACAVSNGKAQRADMVSHHSICHVPAINIILADLFT